MRHSDGLRAALAGSQGRDPNFKNTVLLLHGDGTNGAQNNTFVDGSSNNFTITRNGNTTQGSFSPYGDNWSNYFDGNGDYLSLSTQAVLNVGTGNFTVECFLFFPAVSRTYSRAMVFGPTEATFSTGLQIQLKGATQGAGGIDITLNNTVVISYTTAVAANTWNHIALVREGTGSNQLKLYINGTNVASGTTAASLGTPSYNIGRLQANNSTFDDYYEGYISNLRIVTSAVYTSNFTPSTTPLTAITNTSLLTCQSNRFRDNSTNAFAITRNGDVSVQRFSPFAPSAAYSATSFDDAASQYFDGSGDYLSFANNAAFAFGTGDFTWEFWIYRASTTANLTVFDQRTTGTTANGVSDYINASNKYVLYGNNSDLYTSTTSITPFEWTHIAVARSGSTLRVFINGSLDGSVTNSLNLSDQSLLIGVNRGATAGSVSTGYFNGYVSNLRILKGTAQYTAAFTPSTTPLTAITNTSLLTCQNYTVRDNSTNNFAITVNGNTRGDRLVPFGNNWSNFFDGTGDYLSLASNAAFGFGTGDFTIECWLNVPNTTGIKVFYETRPTTGGSQYPILYIDGTSIIWNSGPGLTATSAITASTWTHVAVTRSGTTLRLFVNGSIAASNSSDSTNYANPATGRPFIGADTGLAGNWYNGYISNFRILKGTAQYTSAFTPPTSPLTAITNTSLLTCQSNRFIDNSTNAFTITRNGDVRVENENPFPAPVPTLISAIGGSGYFDGTGDYLQITRTASLLPGASTDFSVEAWVYLTTYNAQNSFICGYYNRGVNGDWEFQIKSTGVLFFYFATGGIEVNSGANVVPLNQWTHVAVCRSGTGSNNVKIYIDGVERGSGTTNNSASAGTALNFTVGGDTGGDGNMFTGYISNLRILNGSAAYAAAFTPSTAPLTAVTNTSLLCNFTNAGIYDNAMMNDLETVGNAQISTTQKKYGTGALYFDGTGDYLTMVDHPGLRFPADDFTIEYWFYVSAFPSSNPGEDLMVMVNKGGVQGSLNPDYGTAFSNSSGSIKTKVSLVDGGTTRLSLTGSTTISTATWYHFAFTRSGNTGRLFINGTQDATGTVTGNVGASTRPLLVGYETNAISRFYFNGYIDDLRITKGVARYTANFTPPAAPLADF